jgi:hypothetical protein
MGNSKPGTGDGEAETGRETRGGSAGSPVQESDGGLSRRDWLKVIGITGAASVASGAVDAAQALAPLVPPNVMTPPAKSAEVLQLTSTSDVFVPPRGDAFMKFSFDFPEPSVAFGGLRFGFLVFTDENTYGLDAARITADDAGDTLRLTCTGFVWAGGQEKAPGSLVATFRRSGSTIEWDTVVEMARPVKTVTTIIRDVPRGKISLGGGAPFDAHDNEMLGGYTFGAGDLHGPGASVGITTALAAVQAGEQDFFYLSSLDNRVRPKRFYFQPGERAYRVEAVYEHDAWRNDTRLTVPRWRVGRAPSLDDAVAPHMAHVERAFGLQPWETRTDVQPWQRQIALVTTLHGMHYTGFMFNDYGRMLEILRWMATQIPPERVLAFISAWDGRYYWDYPNYVAPARMGGEAGFKRLISEGRKLGFRMMPMFGANSANRKQPVWSRIASGVTQKVDGDRYDLNWVDWNNDRHQDGWLTYMNLGADAWRNHLTGRIADAIERYGVDAYFLDIVGGHVNSTTGDMHEGTRRLVMDLHEKYPNVACVGEMPYDALHGFIPMYHAGGGARWRKYSRFFQHLSAPAPGRGSSGVHESGFGRFNAETLGLSPNAIPTLQVVDDTFTQHRDAMAAIIAAAKARAGIA